MGMNTSEEKLRRLRAQEAGALAWDVSKTLTVVESDAADHQVVGRCECGRERRIVPMALIRHGHGHRIWRELVRAQVMVCASCRRGFRMLAISQKPEKLCEIWRDK